MYRVLKASDKILLWVLLVKASFSVLGSAGSQCFMGPGSFRITAHVGFGVQAVLGSWLGSGGFAHPSGLANHPKPQILTWKAKTLFGVDLESEPYGSLFW